MPRQIRFKRLRPVTELDSPFNREWYPVTVAGAAILLGLTFIHFFIFFKLIGVL